MTSNNTQYIVPSTIVGTTVGAVYGFRKPSEKTCQKAAFLHPTTIEAMEEYKNSFNMDKAAQALKNKKITKDEFKIIEDIYNGYSNVIEKEAKLNKILNTPFNKRTQTYKSAVKEANEARFALYKHTFKLAKNMQKKFGDLDIFNLEKFSKTTKAVGKKAKQLYKLTAKGAIKPAIIGLLAGSAFGLFLNHIAGKNS